MEPPFAWFASIVYKQTQKIEMLYSYIESAYTKTTSALPRYMIVVLFCCCGAFSPRAQIVDEVVYRGRVSINGQLLAYTLHIVCQPDGWRGKSDIDRVVTSIKLSLDGFDISFPPEALKNLSGAPLPTVLHTSSTDDSQGEFDIPAGYGRKEFTATFLFDKDHLLSRKSHYDRLESADMPDEIIHFDKPAK